MGQNNYLCPKDGEDLISFLNILCFLFLIVSAARIGTGTDLHLELMKLVTIIHMSYFRYSSPKPINRRAAPDRRGPAGDREL